jgi:hypothetical protein
MQSRCGNTLGQNLSSRNPESHQTLLNSLPSNSHAPNLSYLVRLASDDLAAYVTSSLKQQICKGEYENLSLLLIIDIS